MIERAQWKKLVDELRLSLSDLFNEEKAAQLGEQLGAEVMGLGSFVVFAGSVNVNIRFVDVETGTVLGASSLVSPVDGRLFEAFATLALDAVEVLNRQVIGGEVASLPPGEKIEVPEETREKIEKPATKTFDAYALHGKGREAYDQNRWDEAIALYQQALTLDRTMPRPGKTLERSLKAAGGGTRRRRRDVTPFLFSQREETKRGRGRSSIISALSPGGKGATTRPRGSTGRVWRLQGDLATKGPSQRR